MSGIAFADLVFRKGELYVRGSKKPIREAGFKQWMVMEKSKPCMDCGGSFPSCVMDFHHRDPRDKNFDVSQGATHGRRVVLVEIEKCDLLCANCHRMRHSKVVSSRVGKKENV